MDKKGLVHIYCGDGKGKTTAAFGLAFRCAGRGNNVVIAQFLKGNVTGEVISAEKFPNITVVRGNTAGKFTFQMTENEKNSTAIEQENNFDLAVKMCLENNCRLLILDEIMAALSCGFIEKEKIIDFLNKKPSDLEVVLTGRNPPEELISLADYVSEIKKVKHPFDKGIPARNGIEK